MKEWKTFDKSTWGPGPWQEEPDKRQWTDKATGYPCLAVRNHGGAWCGYVGAPPSHPLHGKDYDSARSTAGDYFEVHGGLTFSDACHMPTPERWEQWRQHIRDSADEARLYPKGDAARNLREAGTALDDYPAYVELMHARSICHIPEPGSPDNVWWFGFDCAHSGDCSPGYRGVLSVLADGTYRTIHYVEREVARLATQLAEVK